MAAFALQPLKASLHHTTELSPEKGLSFELSQVRLQVDFIFMMMI